MLRPGFAVILACAAPSLVACSSKAKSPAPTVAQPTPPSPEEPPPPQPAEPTRPVEPAQPSCASELASAMSQPGLVYAIIHDGAGNRCMELGVRPAREGLGGLKHTHIVRGDKWVKWERTVVVHMAHRVAGNQLTVHWMGAGTSKPQIAACGQSFAGKIGMGFGRSGPPPLCGPTRTVTACRAGVLQLTDGALYPNEGACKKALAAGAQAMSLGDCNKHIAARYTEARQGPTFDKTVTEAALRLEKLIARKRMVYWFDPAVKTFCQRWQLEPGKRPGSVTLSRSYRIKRRRIVDAHEAHLRGLDLELGLLQTTEYEGKRVHAMGRGGNGPCLRVTGGDKHSTSFDNGVSWYNNLAACRRARRKALRKPKSQRKRAP